MNVETNKITNTYWGTQCLNRNVIETTSLVTKWWNWLIIGSVKEYGKDDWHGEQDIKGDI